jgi:hypothetical protein
MITIRCMAALGPDGYMCRRLIRYNQGQDLSQDY